MLHPTMLGDVGPTCWLRLNRPLEATMGLKGHPLTYISKGTMNFG